MNYNLFQYHPIAPVVWRSQRPRPGQGRSRGKRSFVTVGWVLFVARFAEGACDIVSVTIRVVHGVLFAAASCVVAFLAELACSRSARSVPPFVFILCHRVTVAAWPTVGPHGCTSADVCACLTSPWLSMTTPTTTPNAKIASAALRCAVFHS